MQMLFRDRCITMAALEEKRAKPKKPASSEGRVYLHIIEELLITV